MDRGGWWTTVHGVAKSQARLSDTLFTKLTEGAYSKESFGSTYFWKSIGGDFKASRFRKEEAEEKAREPLHRAGCLCPALRRGVWGGAQCPLNHDQRGTAEQYSWPLKRRKEKRALKLCSKPDKYLFWSSNLSSGGGSDAQRLFKQPSQRQSLGCKSKSGSDGCAVFFFFPFRWFLYILK